MVEMSMRSTIAAGTPNSRARSLSLAKVTPLRTKQAPGTPPRAPWRGLVALAAVVALLAAAALWRESRVRGSVGRSCETAIVVHGPMSGTLRARGQLMTEREIRVGSEGPVRVVSVRAREGDRVNKGQILAVLDHVEERAKLTMARARVTSATLLGLRAERELNQIVASLQEEGLLPQDLLADDLLEGAAGDAQLELLNATAEATRQEAALRLARALVARRTIRAPEAGVVLARSIEAGETTPSSPPGPPLFVIGSDPSRLRMEVDIDERYVGGLGPGPTTFTTPGHGSYAFSASIERVVSRAGGLRSPAPYTVVLSVPNADGALAPGSSAIVELPVRTTRDALHVPVDAVVQGPDAASIVWLADEQGRAVASPVEVGVVDNESAEVQGPGLAAGRVIVTDAAPLGCLVRMPPSPFGGREP
jgi:RND family efflux transporter MFP subunit